MRSICPHCGEEAEENFTTAEAGKNVCQECEATFSDPHDEPDPDQYGTAWRQFRQRHGKE
jgi:sarcosine oxidase delta subunit